MRVYKRFMIFGITILLLSSAYLIYYQYRQSKMKIRGPEGFSIEYNSENLTLAGLKWMEAYIQQYQQKYLANKIKLRAYSIVDIVVLEENVLQINFTVEAMRMDERNAALWQGMIWDHKIQCQWVLWFDKKATENGAYVYTVTRLQRPAGYDLDKYQRSGQKEKDEYKHKYLDETPYEERQYTYRIKDGKCSVSYDGGKTWAHVPVDLEDLAAVGDGNAYYNKLQQGSYVIAPQKTAFVYGGTRQSNLMITYMDDEGDTWNTTKISEQLNSVRVKFCSFPTRSVGYVIATNDRAMSQESQIIYKTTDGGATWRKMGYGPSTWLLKSAGFLDENVGFMCYPKIEGAETNFYRTDDGGKTFKPIILPIVQQEWMGLTLEPFIEPETPYLEGGMLFILVSQGPNGDFKGGTSKAKYKSEDMGITWSFVEIVEPPSQEIG